MNGIERITGDYMGKRWKRLLIGKPLKNEAIDEEKLNVMWGLPILSSDAISSVAYAGQEMLVVLLPFLGVLAYSQVTVLSGAIIGLLALLVLSYSQTIENYPNGGGAYIVAKDNLGVLAGVTAGAALSVDYVMTVAVSISSGVEQLTSICEPLRPYTIWVCVLLVLILMLGNLRGISESSKMFSIPAYAFMLSLIILIVTGIFKYMNGYRSPEPPLHVNSSLTGFAFMAILLRAFSSGCIGLSGVEAVSNAVPAFKDPPSKHAKKVLVLLALVVAVLFGGTSLLANMYHVMAPGVRILGAGFFDDRATLVQIADKVFNGGIMYYVVSVTTFIILVMAANTAYSGFPLLVSVMAREGYAPRQLSMRGDRLSFSNGIIVLSSVSILLIVIFSANVTQLIGLYAIGVFISFTLSQSGMFAKWIRQRGKNWVLKACVNGLGAILTAIAVILAAVTKFHQGAWIVVIIVPILIVLMLKVKKHYTAIAKQLKISNEELRSINISKDIYRNRVIVPIESLNKASIRALRYARTISENVTAFNVSIDEESGKRIRERYNMLDTDIPLIIKYSPFRKVVDPLLKFIESAEYDYKKSDMITVILPQFAVKSWWNKFLHNHTRVFIERELLKHKHIVISTMPLQLKYDDYILKKKQ